MREQIWVELLGGKKKLWSRCVLEFESFFQWKLTSYRFASEITFPLNFCC